MKAEARNITAGLLAWLGAALAIAIASPAGATAISKLSRGIVATAIHAGPNDSFGIEIIDNVLAASSHVTGDGIVSPGDTGTATGPLSYNKVRATVWTSAKVDGSGTAESDAILSGIIRVTNAGSHSARPDVAISRVYGFDPSTSIDDPVAESAGIVWSIATAPADLTARFVGRLDEGQCEADPQQGWPLGNCSISPIIDGIDNYSLGVMPILGAGGHVDIAYRIEISASARSVHPMYSTPDPVPEPSAALLLAAGIAALTWRKKAR
jgi:hypothetical protein